MNIVCHIQGTGMGGVEEAGCVCNKTKPDTKIKYLQSMGGHNSTIMFVFHKFSLPDSIKATIPRYDSTRNKEHDTLKYR